MPSNHQQEKTIKILVADDDLVCLKILSTSLIKWGFEVISALDGGEAWEILNRKNPPKIAVLDWMMPKLEGPEICRRLKQKSEIFIYPIILTSRIEVEDIVEGLDSGAQDYISKPIKIDEFKSRIGTAVRIVEYERLIAQSTKQLKQSELKWRSLVETTPDIILNLERDGEIKFINHGVGNCSSKDLVGSNIYSLIDSKDHQRVEKSIENAMLFLSTDDYEISSFGESGQTSSVYGVRVSPVKSGDEAVGVTFLVSDISKRKITEKELIQSRKLESVGQLAAGIAHEINTPTQYVQDNIEFLKESYVQFIDLLGEYENLVEVIKKSGTNTDLIKKIEDCSDDIDLEFLNEEIPKALEQSSEGLGRISKIVLAMKEFSHPGSKEKQATDINRAIQTTMVVARNEWKYFADVKLELDPNIPFVLCMPGEINQVFLNLIVNAAHALSDKSKMTDGEKGTITIRTRLDGSFVEIQIADTANGIPQEVQSKIFDPFFTTKEVGKGTGQGLAIAHSVIVEKHNGSLNFESKIGLGTIFYISLPINCDEDENDEENLDD